MATMHRKYGLFVGQPEENRKPILGITLLLVLLGKSRCVFCSRGTLRPHRRGTTEEHSVPTQLFSLLPGPASISETLLPPATEKRLLANDQQPEMKASTVQEARVTRG